MGLQNRATNNVTSTKMLRPTNKDSVYTFSDNSGSDRDDNSSDIDKIATKYRPRLNVPTKKDRIPIEPQSDKGKKKSTASRPSNKSRRKQVATSTMPSPTMHPPSFAPFPCIQQPIAFLPPFDSAYVPQQPKSNGSMLAGTVFICKSSLFLCSIG